MLSLVATTMPWQKPLSTVKSKGRVAITGTLGYQIAYLRSVATEKWPEDLLVH
jgi:hypothetical protein